MPYSLGTEFMFRVCSHVPFLMGAVLAFVVSVLVFTITLTMAAIIITLLVELQGVFSLEDSRQ